MITEPSMSARIASLVASAEKKPHGTRARYTAAKCRCTECRRANRDYNATRNRELISGSDSGRLVSSAPARAHMLALSARGVGYKSVADTASVSLSVAGRILWGMRLKIRQSTSERILAVTAEFAADGARVPAGPTWRILDSLIAEGYTKTQLAKWLGSKSKVPVLQIGRDFVNARTASKVERIAKLIDEGRLARS